MQGTATPELLEFILRLAQISLIAFSIMIAGAAVVYVTLFWRGDRTPAPTKKPPTD